MKLVALQPGKIKEKKIFSTTPAYRPTIFRLAVASAAFLLLVNLLLWHWLRFQHVNPPRLPSAHAPVDAVAVLTGSAGRINTGAALWQEGRAKRLLIIGAHPSATAAAIIQAGGIKLKNAADAKAVLVEHRSYNTRTNMVELRRLCRQLRIDSLVIVTSAFHERRAYLLARRLLPSDLTIAFQPAENNLPIGGGGWQQIHEFIKYLAALPYLVLTGQ
jgi:uncharacterized SAM-binding protein YcdF (DUF218 family)